MWRADFNIEEIKLMEVVKIEYLVHTYIIHNIHLCISFTQSKQT